MNEATSPAVTLPGSEARESTLTVRLSNLKPGEAQFARNVVALMCDDRPEFRAAFENLMGGKSYVIGAPNGALTVYPFQTKA